jgi:GWxTD domain-containing protein
MRSDVLRIVPARGLVRPLLLGAALVLGVRGGALSQPQGPGPSQVPGSAIMIEAFARGEADSARRTVDIHYRIEAGFFVPVKNGDASSPDAFVRRGELLIELIDSTGVTRAREIARLERRAAGSERPRPGTEWFQGGFSLSVPFGSYAVLVEVTDAESQRSITDRSRRIRIQPSGTAAPEGAPSIFVNTPRPGESPDTLRIHNFGGDVQFGSAVSLYAEFAAGSLPSSPIDAVITYEMLRPDEEDAVVVRTDTAAGIRPVIRPRPARMSDTVGLAYLAGDSTQPAVDALVIPLNTQRLPLRRYRMTAVFTGVSGPVTIRRDFRMVWPDMPRSMRNVDEALAALRYVAPESTIDSLRDGPLEARWANLEAFWKPRDRSPETALNEVAIEYYRRVDHARESFGTIRQQDGFLTDRGRIYVLHGPPTNTERSLDPSEGFRETWTYARGNRTFVFVDRTKTGDYILMQRPPQ